MINIQKEENLFTVKDAISDLPKLKPGEGAEKIKSINKHKNVYLKKIANGNFIYNHVARNHNDKDRQRYKFLSKNNWELRDLKKTRPRFNSSMTQIILKIGILFKDMIYLVKL